MGLNNDTKAEGTFISVVGGRLAQKVEEGTEGAVSRVNKNGKTVWERFFKSYDGIVRGWQVNEFEYEGKKMKSLNVFFPDITLSISGKMKNEFIKKFSGAVQDQPITITPYPDFVGKDGVIKKSGLTITQDGNRLYDHFTDYNDGVFTQKHGFPVPPKKWADMTDADKQIYNIQCDSFLEDWVEKHPINNIGAGSPEAPEEEIKIEDVPF